MQILEIVVYSRDGRKRVVPLRPGALNIITGRSHTGKSALIYIVSYCMGGSSQIPEGRILEAASWFGVLLDCGDERVFVARENGYPALQSTTRAFIERGAKITSPDSVPTPNTTSDKIEQTLTKLVGISPNLHVPPVGHTRLPLAANIRHALIFCFQHQTEIGTNQILFHRQSEDFMPQAIKDTLPYFLGAVPEDHLALVQELARLKRELRLLEQQKRENDSIQGEGLSRAQALLAEATAVGLVSPDIEPDGLAALRTLLQEVVEWKPDQPSFSGADLITQLQEEIARIETERQQLTDAIRTAKAFAKEAQGFTTEAEIQAARLESIGLFENAHDSKTCPVCSQELATAVPSAAAIQQSFEQIRSNLATVTREQPRLREYIEGLETKLSGVLHTKTEKEGTLNSLLNQQSAAKQLRDLNVRRGMAIGRIGLWLQSLPESHSDTNAGKQIDDLRQRIGELEAATSSQEEEDRLTSILNRLSVQMTAWAKRLDLEFSDNPVRLDVNAATLVIDRPDRPVPLRRLGAGDNWVGYHLVSHLALHNHFRRHNRPVPSFLFLDQPTQAFFPADRDAEMQGKLETIAKDDDRARVTGIFKLLLDFVKELAPTMQVVVTDHADLSQEDFQKAVVARWRAVPDALIPEDWPNVGS